ncbi:SLC13 family permease [Microbacterium sp. P01]|uniref:SLC13 family permease n=1 Tax=Microbacterium sp. P01 TaxID=3366261 RepID=UPI00366E5901
MLIAVIGALLFAASVAALATGVLPVGDALAIGDRVWPILVFVVAMTVVAELAARAGLFDVIAAFFSRWAGGRTWLLWLLVVALGVFTTAFLSLDTTAVLLTPVVVVMARSSGLPPFPFALTTVWLANTASLVLPISNLTNLLAMHPLGFTTAWPFVGLLGGAAAVAIIVPVMVIAALYRQVLRSPHTRTPPPQVSDRPLLRVVSVVVVLLLPALVSGVPPWIPTTVATAILIAVYAVRAPRALRLGLVPWSLLLFAGGLFLAVGTLEALGSGAVVSAIAGDGDGVGGLLQMAGVGMLGSNAVNNLPAYLAIESSAASPTSLAALLIGVNAGPLITPWASLATLLWHDRLVKMGVEVRWSRFVLLGLVVAPLTVGLSTLALALG